MKQRQRKHYIIQTIPIWRKFKHPEYGECFWLGSCKQLSVLKFLKFKLCRPLELENPK